MIGWNEIFEAEVIKKTVLLTNRLTHHHRDSPLTPSAPRNHARSAGDMKIIMGSHLTIATKLSNDWGPPL